MADDSVRLNVTPDHPEPTVVRVLPTAGVAAARAIGSEDTSNESTRPEDYQGREPRPKQPVAPEGTVEQLEVKIAAANKHLKQNGTAINLRLHVDEEGVLHLEIEDHRAAEGPVVQRVRIIEHNEITRLINDLLGEVGICIDTTA